ncbi:hypothetical protein [Magnetospirillum molischianum]|uniref:Uncharacterized protein n=1 Tax=Magnetospirillum molischianum DSM 120 TaxID=1150626 RepID=H8FY39_MAGML|nr:hypothetical protein [Magnetospirillum molischianum]CCG43277.1 hypothetical protein PHAMO_80068 [Magnetospirillum molischianum DSM 120]
MSRLAALDANDTEWVGIGMTDKCVRSKIEGNPDEYDRQFDHLVGLEPGWNASFLITWDGFIRLKHVLELVTCLVIIAGVYRHWS